MIEVDLIGRIRRAFHEERRGIKTIAREFEVSRTTVRKVVRTDKTEFRYERSVQPAPKLGAFVEDLTAILEELWPNLGDDDLMKAAYRGSCETSPTLPKERYAFEDR